MIFRDLRSEERGFASERPRVERIDLGPAGLSFMYAVLVRHKKELPSSGKRARDFSVCEIVTR